MENDFTAAVASWAPILFMVLIFYFLLYRPQKNAKKARDEMLSSLQIGTKIITAGGIYGVITEVKGDILKVQIADRVEIQMARSAVGMVNSENIAEDKED